MADSLPKRGGMSLTTKIVIGMAAGLITGTILNIIGSAGVNSWLVDGLFAMIGTAFVNGLKMLVVPLVVFSLLCGVLGIGDIRMLGRVGGKSFALYIATTAIAIATAILLGLLIGPGEGFVMEGVDTSGVTAAEAPTVWQVFANIVPSNPVASLANGDMLQIIFYTIVVGIAALMLGEQSTGFAKACEYMNELAMKIVEIVMSFAPYGVFCLIAKVFAKEGIDLFIPVLAYVVTLTGALLLHLFVTLMLILKLMSGLDISEKRLPQDGRFAIKVRNNMIDVRISTMPTQHGESVVMRLLNQNTGLLGLDRLNMPARTLERLRHAVRRPSGMVLVTGPTGSGKTTTLYAALSELNTTEKKIITVEDPVEYRLPGINQVQVHEKIDLSFDRVLRSALRQDPDIVLVGEMRDQTTAEIGMRAAITGHMVLSTLHTNDVISTPIRLLDMGVPRYMVALSLQLVLAQRLVRVVCENCAEPYAPTPHEHEWLRYELGDTVDQRKYMHGKGCAHCGGTGYAGRTGVYEMLEMTNEIVEAINSDDTGTFVQAARKQMAGETLRRDAVRQVVRGRTTIEEAMRISNQFED